MRILGRSSTSMSQPTRCLPCFARRWLGNPTGLRSWCAFAASQPMRGALPIDSKCCLPSRAQIRSTNIRPPPDWRNSGTSVAANSNPAWPSAGQLFLPWRACLDFDLQPDLHDLRGRDPEIGRREIGIEVHRGEQCLSPCGHAWHLVVGYDHHPAEVVGDQLGIDPLQAGIAAGELQAFDYLWVFHEAVMQENPG